MNKVFFIYELFDVTGTRTTKLDELAEIGPGPYPYVTTQSTNNGVAGKYNTYTEEGNVLVMDSAVLGFCSYQEENFTASDHVEKLKPKFEMNKFIGLYVATVINANQYRFCYGRKANQGQINNLKISLPIDENEEPDWKAMEQYIKSIWNEVADEIIKDIRLTKIKK